MSACAVTGSSNPAGPAAGAAPPDATRLHAEWPRDALVAGTELNGFRIEAVIGRGGFGITYRAADSIDQLFAIKECFPRQFAVRHGRAVFAAEPKSIEPLEECVRRFGLEAKALCHVCEHSPAARGIVKVVTFFFANNTAYLVMELLQGDTLAELIRHSPAGVPPVRLDNILDGLLDALATVHDAGLLHRDIKPSNIFLTDSGRPVLVDFGAVRAISRGQTSTFTRIYSEGFACIEQFTGSPQGPPADIYAFGATLYTAIGGTVIDAITRSQAALKGDPDPQPSAAVIGAGRYRPELLGGIDAALAVFPDKRPQSVAALRARMYSGEQETVFARPGPAGDGNAVSGAARIAERSAGRVFRLSPLRQGMALAVFSAALALSFFTGYRADNKTHTLPVQQSSGNKKRPDADLRSSAVQLAGMLRSLQEQSEELHRARITAQRVVDDLQQQVQSTWDKPTRLEMQGAWLAAIEKAALAAKVDKAFAAMLQKPDGLTGTPDATLAAAQALIASGNVAQARSLLGQLRASVDKISAVPSALSNQWQVAHDGLVAKLAGRWGLGGCKAQARISTWIVHRNHLQILWPNDPIHELVILYAMDDVIVANTTLPASEAGQILHLEPSDGRLGVQELSALSPTSALAKAAGIPRLERCS
jgi:hypothetical protein